MSSSHFARVDLGAGAAFLTASGLSAASKTPDAPLRFIEYHLFEFTLGRGEVFVTITDALALVSAFVLTVRFIAWAVAPLFKSD